LPAVALLVGVLGLAAFSVFHATWYRVESMDLGFLRSGEVGVNVWLGHIAVNAVLALALMYFFVRLFAAGILLLIGGPAAAGLKLELGLPPRLRRIVRVAWLTPGRARVHGAIVLALTCVAFALPLQLELEGAGVSNLVVERAFGGWLLIASLVLAQLAIHVIARDPLLAATQLWGDKPAAAPPPRKRRRSSAPSAPIGASPAQDPYRAPPQPDLASKLVYPQRAPTSTPIASTDGDDPAQPAFLK
jgi:hypothetical protein